MTKIEERILVDAYQDTRENTEYKAYIDKIIKLGREIMKHLGDHRGLLLEYERMIGLSEGVYLENVYRIGFEDGQEGVA